MIRLALFQALPAFLAIIQTVSSTPFTSGGYHPGNKSQPNGTVWPTSVAGLAHDENWTNFTKKTIRWSSYEAPTFNEVFLPVTEEDLSRGVSSLHPVLLSQGRYGD
jgi:fumiquinazoline A oxidase